MASKNQIRTERLIIGAQGVAEILGIHVNTVKKIPPNELPYFRIGNRGDRKYRYYDVKAYIMRRTVTGE